VVTVSLSECPHGRYGDNCAYECHCSGEPCNTETGQCLCGAGKTGDDCSQRQCLYITSLRHPNNNNNNNNVTFRIFKRFCSKFIHETMCQISPESSEFYIKYDQKHFGLFISGHSVYS